MEALELGRDSLRVSQVVALEAAKARLDARAPVLRVMKQSVQAEVLWWESPMGDREVLPNSQELRRTKDDALKLVMGANFLIRNEGAVAVEVTLNGGFYRLGKRPLRRLDSVSLAPGESSTVRLEEPRTLVEWTENWSAQERGAQSLPQTIVGEVICSDAFDDGVIDRWRLELWCWPVRPVPDDLSAWRVNTSDEAPSAVNPVVVPGSRSYYRSKSRDELLT
ncbi:hypothetical protein [Micromonospora sediminicola]|uniref:hypothetical protein n=1 Tax=Micromonospora sediminicola TaxID=946078 RepID=UPI003407AAF6